MNILDDVQKLRKKYNLATEQSELFYKKQKKDYMWLYDYFNGNEEQKSNVNTISYGKVCF